MNGKRDEPVKSIIPLSIFLGAFLLFQVELIVAREVLPWFGGAPAVWTTCLVFYQVVLLAGYAYAHLLVGGLEFRRQAVVHITIALLSVLLLLWLSLRWPTPITPGPEWKPQGGTDPVRNLLLLLAVSLAVPFFVLSTTGPLLQRWVAAMHPGQSPYRLYALSNAGSLLGLLLYPLLVEPFLGLRTQAYLWSALYLIFALGVCAAGGALRKSMTVDLPGDPVSPGGEPSPAPRPSERLLWGSLAGVASALLLSTTNHMCLDTAVIPLLWVLPLSAYLVTFILAFRYERLYRRWLFPPLYVVAFAGCSLVLFRGLSSSLLSQVVADVAVLFAGCMVCHGELARARPHAAYLTGFYLAVAAGGAAGGLFVALLAPGIFRGFWEFHISLFATGAVFFAAVVTDRRAFLYRKPALIGPALGVLLAGIGGVLWYQAAQPAGETLMAERNFYGLLRVVADTSEHYVKLMHGRITHGFQYTDSAKSGIPTSYYARHSGIGLAIEYHPDRERGLRIGVVGMGTGTLAAYGREIDTVRFYEINPAVPALSAGAGAWFSFVRRCPGRVEVVMGDARLSLERELERGENQRFDILALDAFSSDAIPVHLLTREAFGIYLRHLRDPDGVLAVHISNRYLDLIPVVHGFAERNGLSSVLVTTEEDDEGAWYSDWILIARSASVLAQDSLLSAATPWDSTSYREIRPWTDDYSNLVTVLRSGEEDP